MHVALLMLSLWHIIAAARAAPLPSGDASIASTVALLPLILGVAVAVFAVPGVLLTAAHLQSRRRRVIVHEAARRMKRERDEALADLDLDARVRRVRRMRVAQPRRPKERLPYTRCEWWLLYHNESSANPRTRPGRKFRRRFRVPPSMVRRIVDLVRESGRWSEGADAVGGACHPVALLVMGCLQVLGRAVPIDLAAEGAHCSEVSLSSIRLCASRYNPRLTLHAPRLVAPSLSSWLLLGTPHLH